MKKTYSAGPLEAVEGFDSWSVRDDYGRVLAVCPDSDEHPNKPTTLPGRQNAVLFAAAPDLLAALEVVAAHFEGTDSPLGETARAAIAKAKGKVQP